MVKRVGLGNVIQWIEWWIGWRLDALIGKVSNDFSDC